METIRSLVEGFLRGRYGYEGYRAWGVLGAAVLGGAVVVVGWLLVSSLTIPRFTTAGPVVRNGVAVIVACGKKQGLEGMPEAMKYAPEPQTGGWWPEEKGQCTIWYHEPPYPTQREARQERARSIGTPSPSYPPGEGPAKESDMELIPPVKTPLKKGPH